MAVYDVMRDLGMKDCVLPHAIRALDPETRVAGRIFTMQGRPDPASNVHESVIRWTEFLNAAPAGHVIVCQPHDHSLALMGELSAETLHLRGVRGYIVDGGCRDNAFIRWLGFPVFARFQTPRDIAGAWTHESFGEMIEIEGVQIRTGDFVLADIDGIIVIPEERAEAGYYRRRKGNEHREPRENGNSKRRVSEGSLSRIWKVLAYCALHAITWKAAARRSRCIGRLTLQSSSVG